MTEIRLMTCSDLACGGRLSQQAGWNQTAADWLRFFELQPGGCFLAELDGQPVGTVTTCVYDRVGWIGMMLVDPAARSRGVGRALMDRAIRYLESLGADSIRLDATPLGEPLYASLGFKPQYRLTRFAGSPLGDASDGQLQMPDWEQIAAFDQPLTGYSRQKLFRRFGEEPDIRAIASLNGEQMQGYICTRPGRLAWYVGPCMAIVPAVGKKLLRQALGQLRGQSVFVDVLSDKRAAVEAAESVGLKPARELVRMSRGKEMLESLESLWASGGPAKG